MILCWGVVTLYAFWKLDMHQGHESTSRSFRHTRVFAAGIETGFYNRIVIIFDPSII